jgi:hypothetical protein
VIKLPGRAGASDIITTSQHIVGLFLCAHTKSPNDKRLRSGGESYTPAQASTCSSKISLQIGRDHCPSKSNTIVPLKAGARAIAPSKPDARATVTRSPLSKHGTSSVRSRPIPREVDTVLT